MQNMAKIGKPTYPPDEQDRVRVVVRALLKERGSKQAVGKLLGVSRQSIGTIVDKGGGPSLLIVRNLAKHLKMSEVELLTGRKPAASPSIVLADGERTVEYLRRYPNADVAAEFARREGVSDEAIRDVADGHYSLPSDAGPQEWLDMMKARNVELKHAARGLALDQARTDAATAASDAHIEEAKVAGKPKLKIVKKPKGDA